MHIIQEAADWHSHLIHMWWVEGDGYAAGDLEQGKTKPENSLGKPL